MAPKIKKILLSSIIVAAALATPSVASAQSTGGGAQADPASTAITSMTTDFTAAVTLIEGTIVPIAVGSVAFGGAMMLIKRFIYG